MGLVRPCSGRRRARWQTSRDLIRYLNLLATFGSNRHHVIIVFSIHAASYGFDSIHGFHSQRSVFAVLPKGVGEGLISGFAHNPHTLISNSESELQHSTHRIRRERSTRYGSGRSGPLAPQTERLGRGRHRTRASARWARGSALRHSVCLREVISVLSIGGHLSRLLT